MEKLIAGSTININRSDGRVHPAVVVAVNNEGNFVRVEWFENGETKGKDIDCGVVTVLNPHLKTSTSKVDIVKSQRNFDDSLVNKSPRKGGAIPIKNNKRATSVKRFTQQFMNENNGSNVEVVASKMYSTRSQSRPGTMGLPSNTASVVQEISKMERSRIERRQKQAVQHIEKRENQRRTQNHPYWQLSNMISEYREKIKFAPLMDVDEIEDHLITVCVRKRPLNKQEINKKEIDIISIPNKNQLIVHEPKTKVDLTKYIDNHSYVFDYAFDETCDNAKVYRYTAQPLVKTIFEGGFATCFAYGQTGSGKTYTMSGDMSDAESGVYAMAIADVFRLVHSAKYRLMNFTVSCSFFEIYGGKVLDLLHNKAILKILEDGKKEVQVVGLTETVVSNTNEVLALISKGNVVRTSGQTSANSNSSRSHAIFQIYLRKQNKIYGKFSLIDLAGNERGADTFSSDRQTRLEGGEINKSLLALKECIRALGRKGAHLPFRVSKLTQVLRDSFVGSNSRTCMIAMVSPSVCSCENTLNTLRYADRVKELGTNDIQSEPDLELAPSQKIKSTTEITNEPLDTVEDMEEGECISMEVLTAENNLINNHKEVLLTLNDLAKKGEYILSSAVNSIDFDKRKYAELFENLVDDTISHLLNTKDFIDDYKNKLNDNDM